MSRGKYIVIEGPSGAGKKTQAAELARRLQAAGLPVRLLSEPDSPNDPTAHVLHRLMQDPQYPMNTRADILLYNAARAQSLDIIRKNIEQGVICIVDRNFLSTLALQYYGQGNVPDYETINRVINFAVGSILPDLCIVLDAPVMTLRERSAQASAHDEAFLERVRAGYLWEAKQRGFPVVFTTENKDKIAQEIWQLVTEALAVRGTVPSSNTETSEPASIKEVLEAIELPPHEPPAPEQAAVSSITQASTQTTAQAAIETTKTTTEQVVRSEPIGLTTSQLRVIRGSHLLLQRAQPQLYYYAERPLAPDQLARKDSRKRYAYYLPGQLGKELKKQYREAMDHLFDNYDKILQALRGSFNEDQATALAATVLPLATKSSVEVYEPTHQLSNLIVNLLGDDLPEAVHTARDLLATVRASDPAYLEELADAKNGTAVKKMRGSCQVLQKIALDNLPTNHEAAVPEAVKLLEAWPRNELDLIVALLYEFTGIPLEELRRTVSGWPYQAKLTTLQTYFNDKNGLTPEIMDKGSILDKIRYEVDVVGDYLTFRSVEAHRLFETIKWQPLTPRYGYEVPPEIDQAKVTELYEDSFDTSLQLNSQLYAANHQAEADYAMLFGHRLRWNITLNSRQLLQLVLIAQDTAAGSSLRGMVNKLLEQVAEAHPLLAASLPRQVE